MTIGQAISIVVAVVILAAIIKAISAMANNKIDKEFEHD